MLVSQSGVGYYGDRADALVDESTPPGESFDAQVCVSWEAAAREADQVGIRVAVTRTGLVLEPRNGLLKQLLLPFKLGLGGPIAGGGQYMPWIHVADEVRVLQWALDTESASGAYNATSPNPVTNREFSKTLARVLGRPALLPVPKAALRLRFGEELDGYPRRRAARDASASARRRVRVQPPRARACPARAAQSLRELARRSARGAWSALANTGRPAMTVYPARRLSVVSPTSSIE